MQLQHVRASPGADLHARARATLSSSWHKAKGGAPLTDADGSRLGDLQAPKKGDEEKIDSPEDDEEEKAEEAQGEDEQQQQQVEGEEEEEEEEGEECSADEEGNVSIACTIKNCRKWRDVEQAWLANKEAEDEDFMFQCKHASKRCRDACDYCEQRSWCKCVCPTCEAEGLGRCCICPSSG